MVESVTGLSCEAIETLIRLKSSSEEKEMLDTILTYPVGESGTLIDLLLSTCCIYALNTEISNVTIENRYIETKQELEGNDADTLLRASANERFSDFLCMLKRAYSDTRAHIQQTSIDLKDAKIKALEAKIKIAELEKQKEAETLKK